jgi:hypothetical protein
LDLTRYQHLAVSRDAGRYAPTSLDLLRSILSDARTQGVRAMGVSAGMFHAAPPAGPDCSRQGRLLLRGLLDLLNAAGGLASMTDHALDAASPPRPETLDAEGFAALLGDALTALAMIAQGSGTSLHDAAARSLAAQGDPSPPLVRTGPGGLYTRDYHGDVTPTPAPARRGDDNSERTTHEPA